MRTPFDQTLSEEAIRTLLDRYGCPTPYEMVRTLFMGNIASPVMGLSPVSAIKALWFGDFPEFETEDDANTLFEGLLSGVWNGLTIHQERKTPFQLIRRPVALERSALAALSKMRLDEIGGFIDGLYGDHEQVLFPAKALSALSRLVEVYGMFDISYLALVDDTIRPVVQSELNDYMKNAQKMTLLAEELINKIIQSTKRARSSHSEPMAMAPVPYPFDNDSDDIHVIESSLSQEITRHGVTVQVEIYTSADEDNRWILEVIDRVGTSHVWDARFETDAAALAEAIRALEDEPMEFMGEVLPDNKNLH